MKRSQRFIDEGPDMKKDREPGGLARRRLE